MEKILQEAQERLLEKRKAIQNHTQLTLKGNDEELQEIIERVKNKRQANVEKPNYMAEEEWREENEIEPEIEDDEYNAKRVQWFLSGCGVPEKYKNVSFDDFIGNEKIKNTCKTLAMGEENILLTGSTGSGKTHLAIAILRGILIKGVIENPMRRNERGKILYDPGILGERKRALFITVPRLLMDLRSVFNGNQKKLGECGWEIKTEIDAIKEYTDLELLILDDLGAEKTTDYSLTSLYMILDERINNLKRTIVTTNLSLEELEEKMDARVASRLAGMKIVKIVMPDYRKKR